jgi:regulator of protease activity HflC (stomatin/prohibitin superfamily)
MMSNLINRNLMNLSRPVCRFTSSYKNFSTTNDETNLQWPIKKINTILNVCPQGYKIIVERFGTMKSIQESGLFFAIPFVDKLSYTIDMREVTIEISPQKTITKDNVQVNVSGNLFIIFEDAEKAAYGSTDPLYSIKQHAQSAMRSAIGRMELDDLLHNRKQLNSQVHNALEEASLNWGIKIKRYELTEISPDKQVAESMDRQSIAERTRREQILRAEGDKNSIILKSEGTLIKVTNEAEAQKLKYTLEAQGEAEAIRLKAKSTADSLDIIAKSLNSTELSNDAAKIKIAEEYIKMYSDIGQKSNTFFFNDKPGDVNALFAQAATAVGESTKREIVTKEYTGKIKDYSGGRMK